MPLSFQEKMTLEELINRAFRAKEENNPAVALELYRRAFDLAEDNFIKGMLCRELIFLYRDTGQYLKGAKLLEEYLLNNAPFLSSSLYNQFKRLALYLQKLNALLIEAGQPNLQ